MNTNRGHWLWGIGALVGFLWCTAVSLLAAADVELQVLGWEELGHPPVEETTPFTSGLPVVEGVLAVGDPTAVMDGAGRSIPHQVMPLAFWPDGSIKWLRITLLIEPADRLPYRLIFGAEPDTRQWPDLTVDGHGQGAVVDTGVIRFRLGGEGGLVNDVRLVGGTLAAAGVSGTIVRGLREPRATVAGWLSDATESGLLAGSTVAFRTAGGRDQAVVIEQAGPVAFVARLQGRHVAADGATFSPYDVRVYAYAGLDRVHLQYGFVFDGDPQENLIAGLRLEVNGPFGGQMDVGVEGGDVGMASGVATAIQTKLGEVEINGELVHDANLAGWARAAGEVPVDVFVREMWQQYPKAWRVGDGQLWVELWPEDERTVLDLGRTSDGSGSGEGGGDLTANAVGVSKSHEVVLRFGSGGGDPAVAARFIDSGAIFYPSAEYMTGTGVLGPLPPISEDLFPNIEQSLRHTVYSLAMQRQHEGWYGFIDYGDVRTNRDGASGWLTKGRYGWRNGSADIHGLFLIQFFRSGYPLAWEFGAPYARHVMDVDTVHHADEGSSQLVGSMHRRGQDHWSGSTESQYTYSQGLALYHYLSGDLRARDILIEKIGPYSADPRQARSANAANSCIRLWEATGDPYWLEAARRQMEPHFAPTAYNNFRAYLDFLPALAQYWWLTGDEDAKDAFVRQMEARMGPPNWSDDIGYGSGGPYFMARAILYWMTGDEALAVKFPARAFRDRVPSSVTPEVEWTPESVRAGTSTAPGWRVGMLPYFLGPLIDLGLGEEELKQLPPHRGMSAPTTSHLSARHPAAFHAAPKFKPLEVSATVMGDPLDAPFADETADRTGRTMNFVGLPFGADLEVNGVPFRLIHPANHPERQVLPIIDGRGEVEVAIPGGLSHLHLLGLQVANGWWSEGETVFKLEFRDGDGGILHERDLHYLTDLDDYRGWHFAAGAHFGRFWSMRGQPTYMLQVLTIDLAELGEARALTIREAGNGYVGFLLAATGSGSQDAAAEPVARFTFGPNPGAEDVAVIRAATRAAENAGTGWIEPHDGSVLVDQDHGVASNGQGWLRIALPNGDYMVEMALTNSFRVGGGVLSICTGSHHLEAFSLSNGLDRLWLPARVTDGKLNLRFVPIPELETSRQTTEWSLRQLVIHPVDSLPQALTGPLPMIEFPGRNLASGAKASKSVGNSIRYHNRGVENTIDGDPLTFYSLSASFPEDVIIDLAAMRSLSGVVMTFDPGRVATKIRAQIPDRDDWMDVGSVDNIAAETTIGIDLGGVKTRRLRLLMEGGTSHNLTIRNIAVYGD